MMKVCMCISLLGTNGLQLFVFAKRRTFLSFLGLAKRPSLLGTIAKRPQNPFINAFRSFWFLFCFLTSLWDIDSGNATPQIFTEYHWNIGRFYEDVAEWDGATLTKAFHYITQASKDCPTQFVVMDDETYWDTHPPLPERRRRLRMA